MKEGMKEGAILYLFGGGSSIPTYQRASGGMDRSPIFCKEVTVIYRPLGNTLRKTWVRHGDIEQLVRDKVLADSWLEAYFKLGDRIKEISPVDDVQELMDRMNEFYPEHLI